MKTKVEVLIPEGRYCTGCMLDVVTVWEGEPFYGCEYLHVQCQAEGEYKNRAIKHPDCPSLKNKSPSKE